MSTTLTILLYIASFGLCGVIVRRLLEGRPVIEWEPRYPVPWGVWAGMPAVLLAMLAVLAATAPGDRVTPLDEPIVASSDEASGDELSPADTTRMLRTALLSTVVMLVLLLSILVAVTNLFPTTTTDLGLPHSMSQLWSDVRLGMLTAVAAMLPVLVVVNIAAWLFGEPSHPLIEQMIANPNFSVFAMAAFSAVVVAPLVEEVLFRLLLQGALEKWEDVRAGLLPIEALLPAGQIVVGADGEATVLEPGKKPDDEPQAAADENDDVNPYQTPTSDDEPPRQMLVGDPPPGHGWRSIVISSGLFAAAHAGQGSSPVPLFVLAIMLGYLYQRTHRIVPSIVAHATFNLISVVSVILLVMSGEATP